MVLFLWNRFDFRQGAASENSPFVERSCMDFLHDWGPNLSFAVAGVILRIMAPSPARIGRNDPCYCGSGQKYKKCCLNKPPGPEEAAYKEVLAASEQLRNKILEYSACNFGDRFEEAWSDFNFGFIEGPFDPKDPYNVLFIPFFVFLWDPKKPGQETADNVGGGIVARQFLLDQGARLTEMERELLHSYMTSPTSFYEVLAVQPSEGFTAQDLLTDTTFEVREIIGTQGLLKGHILYAQLGHVGGITTTNVTGPFRIPPEMKEIILEAREILEEAKDSPGPLSQRDLQDSVDDIRERYLEIVDEIMARPELVNTDGEPLEIHTMTFDIPSAQAAFDALAPLAVGIPAEALLHSAEYDSTGALSKVEIPWLKKGSSKYKELENAVLGKLQINRRSLEAEADSEKRARKLRKEIEKRLGRGGAIHRNSKIKLPEEMIDT